MKKEIFILSLLAGALLFSACGSGRGQERVNGVADTVSVDMERIRELVARVAQESDSLRVASIAEHQPVTVRTSTRSARVDIAQVIAVLDSLAAISVNTSLAAREIHDTPVFSDSDWNNIRTVYNNWRQREINSGNFLPECPDWEYFESLSDEESNRYGEIRYALPDISEIRRAQWGRYPLDTIRVDINFDGRQDVIFAVFPHDCMRGIGLAAHPPVYVTAVSAGTGGYRYNNMHINRIKNTFAAFRGKIPNSWGQLWITIDNVKTETGVIEISGGSFIYLSDDASCCPSITYSFTARMDSRGNGYIAVEGVLPYRCDRNQLINHQFELMLAIVN